MAAPTATKSKYPNISIKVTGTNVDDGDNDYVLDFNEAKLDKGFSIVTGTLTAMDVKIYATNNGTDEVDVTQDLIGVLTLASNSAYGVNEMIPYAKVIIRAARTDATNAVNFTIFAPKR